MVNILAITLLTIATLTQDTSADSKTLLQLEIVWNEAHLKGDTIALDKLWASDLVVTVPEMPQLNKTQSLAVWKSGKFKFTSYQTSKVKIKVYGDAAVVTGRLQRTRAIGDNQMADDWLFTKFYLRAKDGWQVVAFHASPAPPEKSSQLSQP